MGRPSKLTDEVTAKVLEAIRCGNTRETAAAYAGVSPATLYSWIAAARKPRARRPFLEFLESLQKAEADAIVTSVALIRKAAQGSWQAAAWWLERRYPDEWGRKDRVTIEALVRQEAERIADELGLDAGDVLAETQRILAASN